MTEGSFSAKKKRRVAMKRRYQIDQQRAVQDFRQLAREENPSIQMIFPMAEVVGLLQEGVGHLLREAGLALMNLVMEEEVRHLAGERHQQHPARRAHRWGKEDGYCVVDGQKVPIRRPLRLLRVSGSLSRTPNVSPMPRGVASSSSAR